VEESDDSSENDESDEVEQKYQHPPINDVKHPAKKEE
jgi:hypothetical protein